ncbi:MAG: DEAD/DEAH box helicase [candidate division WOR-3 bacterium]
MISLYVEFFSLTNLKENKYPVILSKFEEEYKYFKKLKNKILLFNLFNEPIVISEEKKEKNLILEIKRGKELKIFQFINLLINAGYKEYDKVYSEREFARRGYIIDVFFEESELPLRIELFGDFIEDLRFFDPVTQKSVEKKEVLYIYIPEKFKNFFSNLLKPLDFYYINERDFLDKKIDQLPKFKKFIDFIEFLKNKNKKIIYVADNTLRYSYLKKLINNIEFLKGNISESFEIPDEGKIIISERELYPSIKTSQKFTLPFREEEFFEINPGDTVIYEEEGICSIKGFKRIKSEEREIENIELIFQDNQKLYVPFWEIYKIERYFGKSKFTDYSKNLWAKNFLKTKIEIHEFAKKILTLTARRKVLKGISFKLDEEEEKILNEIILSFPYIETEDQKRAWEETKRDLESEKRMDRLIIGDSGFGKTEIALRALAMCALKGYQGLLLAPTTPLVLQHYRNFCERLKDFPLNIRMLSRLITKNEEREIIDGLREGKIDILISTHRALSEDVKFKKLGLLVIDEEQRFGVEHKEKLRLLREELDTLIISATPIPRTLALSIYNILDISRIRTPPKGRKETEIIITNYSLNKVREAIEKELERNGQVIYVRNRISPLKEIKSKINLIFPDVRCEILHGKMSKEEIEDILISFILGEIKILITTSILETGMDFENVNTLIIERPDLFGLSELYALKGRVGRRDRKSYVYLLLPHKLTERARERIKILKRYNYPGSGEKVALKDLEMRGPGEFFGKKQKGFIKKLGINFYIKLLEEEIKKLKGEKVIKIIPKIIPYTSLFFPSNMEDEDKLHISRSLFTAESEEEINLIIEEYKDRFGKPDKNMEKIFLLAKKFLEAKIKGKSKVKVFENLIFIE